jgi:hypothetical protein
MGMAQTVCVLLSASDKRQLEAVASDRNQPAKHVERARVVLASANGRPVQQVATEVEVSRPMVWHWQQRVAEAGPDGLLRDKTRKPGKSPITAETVVRVVALAWVSVFSISNPPVRRALKGDAFRLGHATPHEVRGDGGEIPMGNVLALTPLGSKQGVPNSRRREGSRQSHAPDTCSAPRSTPCCPIGRTSRCSCPQPNAARCKGSFWCAGRLIDSSPPLR